MLKKPAACVSIWKHHHQQTEPCVRLTCGWLTPPDRTAAPDETNPAAPPLGPLCETPHANPTPRCVLQLLTGAFLSGLRHMLVWCHCCDSSQDTLCCFIKAWNSSWHPQHSAANSVTVRWNEWMNEWMIEWMPRGPSRLIHTWGMSQGRCHTGASSFRHHAQLICWDVRQAALTKESTINIHSLHFNSYEHFDKTVSVKPQFILTY